GYELLSRGFRFVESCPTGRAATDSRTSVRQGSRGFTRVYEGATVSTRTPTPRLRIVAPGSPGATHTVIIVMPGGRANDRKPSRASRLASLRMIPLARAARKAARDR